MMMRNSYGGMAPRDKPSRRDILILVPLENGVPGLSCFKWTSERENNLLSTALSE